MSKRHDNIYIITYLLLMLALPIIFDAASSFTAPSEIITKLMTIASGIISAAVVIALYFVTGDNLSEFKNECMVRPNLKNASKYVLLGVAVWFGSTFLSSVMNMPLKLIGISPMQQLENSDNLTIIFLDCVNVCLIAPFIEEILFRGVILKAYDSYGKVFSVLLTSVLFAVAHGSITVFGLPLFIGLICAYTLKKTGCIFYCMLIHAVVNSISFVIGRLPEITPVTAYVILAVGGAVFFMAAAKALRILKRNSVQTADGIRRYYFCFSNIAVTIFVAGYYILLNLLRHFT